MTYDRQLKQNVGLSNEKSVWNDLKQGCPCTSVILFMFIGWYCVVCGYVISS